MAVTESQTMLINGKAETTDSLAPQVNGKLNGINSHIQERHSPDHSLLHITDSRTGIIYGIPITHNSVRALDFKAIKIPNEGDVSNEADDSEGGLRLLDPGFQNSS